MNSTERTTKTRSEATSNKKQRFALLARPILANSLHQQVSIHIQYVASSCAAHSVGGKLLRPSLSIQTCIRHADCRLLCRTICPADHVCKPSDRSERGFSNAHRGNHTAFSNCTLVAECRRRVATCCLCRSEAWFYRSYS